MKRDRVREILASVPPLRDLHDLAVDILRDIDDEQDAMVNGGMGEDRLLKSCMTLIVSFREHIKSLSKEVADLAAKVKTYESGLGIGDHASTTTVSVTTPSES